MCRGEWEKKAYSKYVVVVFSAVAFPPRTATITLLYAFIFRGTEQNGTEWLSRAYLLYGSRTIFGGRPRGSEKTFQNRAHRRVLLRTRIISTRV